MSKVWRAQRQTLFGGFNPASVLTTWRRMVRCGREVFQGLVKHQRPPLSLMDTGPQGPGGGVGGLEPVDREMSCGLCVNVMDGPVWRRMASIRSDLMMMGCLVLTVIDNRSPQCWMTNRFCEFKWLVPINSKKVTVYNLKDSALPLRKNSVCSSLLHFSLYL